MKFLPSLALFLCVSAEIYGQQTARVDLPGIANAKINAISPTRGYPRLEVRDSKDRPINSVRFTVWKNYPGYYLGPAQTKFKVLNGPTADSTIIFAASGSGRADYCNVSVALLGIRNGIVRRLLQKPFPGDYPEGHFYWGDLGKDWGYGLAHWEHARGNRFDDHIRLTLYRYEPSLNKLAKWKVMTTQKVIPSDAPNPLVEFGVRYEDILGSLIPNC